MAPGKFAGRRIIVTGAASGIGKATVEALAAQGARIAGIDQAECVVPNGASIRADLTDPARVVDAVGQAAEALGGVDGVVNSAGIACGTRFGELTDEEWHRTLAINLTAPFLVCRAALPFLREAEAASIVNVASATALLPSALAGTAYAASKGGVLVFTKALAAELAPAIRVNAVCPGLVDTPLMAHALHGEGGPPAGIFNAYSLGRAALPEEIASAILYLMGPDASFVNGIALPVDGGRTYH
jgi:NAD(P)-dependent dehydrogenase (short-subunit alcohol dehydrogenase family)